MNIQIADTKKEDIISNIILKGDISQLSPVQKVEYYNRFCESLGLDPVTQPFQILTLQGKETLYCTKNGSQQLAKKNHVSIDSLEAKEMNGVYIVSVKGHDKDGRCDIATGAVTIGKAQGDQLCNLIMKAETKAKRRLILSLCGLGALDESELETIPEKTIKDVSNNFQTKELSESEMSNKTLLLKLTSEFESYAEALRGECTDSDLDKINKTLSVIESGKATIEGLKRALDYLKKTYQGVEI